MTEPSYAYVPGKGWILEQYAHERLTWIDTSRASNKRHRVTLIAKNPGPGERFFCTNKGDTLEYIKKLIEGNINPTSGGKYEDFKPDPMKYFPISEFVVIEVVPL